MGGPHIKGCNFDLAEVGIEPGAARCQSSTLPFELYYLCEGQIRTVDLPVWVGYRQTLQTAWLPGSLMLNDLCWRVTEVLRWATLHSVVTQSLNYIFCFLLSKSEFKGYAPMKYAQSFQNSPTLSLHVRITISHSFSNRKCFTDQHFLMFKTKTVNCTICVNFEKYTQCLLFIPNNKLSTHASLILKYSVSEENIETFKRRNKR